MKYLEESELLTFRNIIKDFKQDIFDGRLRYDKENEKFNSDRVEYHEVQITDFICKMLEKYEPDIVITMINKSHFGATLSKINDFIEVYLIHSDIEIPITEIQL